MRAGDSATRWSARAPNRPGVASAANSVAGRRGRGVARGRARARPVHRVAHGAGPVAERIGGEREDAARLVEVQHRRHGAAEGEPRAVGGGDVLQRRVHVPARAGLARQQRGEQRALGRRGQRAGEHAQRRARARLRARGRARAPGRLERAPGRRARAAATCARRRCARGAGARRPSDRDPTAAAPRPARRRRSRRGWTGAPALPSILIGRPSCVPTSTPVREAVAHEGARVVQRQRAAAAPRAG